MTTNWKLMEYKTFKEQLLEKDKAFAKKYKRFDFWFWLEVQRIKLLNLFKK